ncbi:MAG TPA: FecR family protein [Burkholderiaceae bacterium]
MRRILLGLTMGLGMGLAVAPAWAQSVCKVAGLAGEVHSGARLLKVGDGLEAGAEIRTGGDGRVRLRCVDGSSLVLGDNSHLQLTSYKAASGAHPRAASLWLEVGVLGQTVSPGGPGSSWEVRTPSAVTAVRGTEFIVEVSAEQGTAVHVEKGEVAVESTVKTRGLVPRPPTKLNVQVNGTQCSTAGACTAASAWSAARVQAVQSRLGGL